MTKPKSHQRHSIILLLRRAADEIEAALLRESRCLWCGAQLPLGSNKRPMKYCNPSHRASHYYLLKRTKHDGTDPVNPLWSNRPRHNPAG